MARHQIIYTSCMRGIDGVNDGQQIFSYDQSFQDSKTAGHESGQTKSFLYDRFSCNTGILSVSRK